METRRFNQLLKSISVSEKSFDELYDFYARRIVFRLSGIYGRDFAEDVMQEFFFNLITGKKDYGYIKSPTSWVYKCAENIAKSKLRSKIPVEQLTDEKEYRRQYFDKPDIKEKLDVLDDVSRKIIELYYWDGYNLQEISELLQITYSAVRKKHSRAKAKLKKFFK